MGGIFINYRGDDSHATAALIDRELTACFGCKQVFLDSRSIPVGADFIDELLRHLRERSVLLVIIGPRWLTLLDDAGQRRIDDPSDWIRREITEALDHRLRIIPVLLDGTALPAVEEVPQDLAGLCRRQYAVLRHRHTDTDLADLVDRIIDAEPGLTAAASEQHLVDDDQAARTMQRLRRQRAAVPRPRTALSRGRPPSADAGNVSWERAQR